MKRFLIIALACLALLAMPAPYAFADPEDVSGDPDFIYFRGVVLRVDEEESSPLDEVGYESQAFYVDVRVTNGSLKGQVLNVYHLTSGNQAYDIFLKPGDKVILQALEAEDGQLTDIYVTSFVRDIYLYVAAGLFVLLVLLLGGKSGLKSLLGLGLTAALIIWVCLPQLLQGRHPGLLAMVVSALSVVLTMFIVAGISRKTFAAILGTVGGVVVAGALAVLVGRISNLTGLSDHEAQMLVYIPQATDFNFQGLLFGGMVIGALGAVMDVGMSIASALFEMRHLRPDLSPWQLFRSGMNVGRDIMGTMTNTLILAYTGGSTSMLLLFLAYEMPIDQIMNMEMIAAELVRAISGSIGLVAAIPLTAAASAWLSRSRGGDKQGQEGQVA
jgi:uncharacterized membrane protein